MYHHPEYMYVFKTECIHKNNLTLMCESPLYLENSTHKNNIYSYINQNFYYAWIYFA